MDDPLFSATDQQPMRRVVGRPFEKGRSGCPGGKPAATTSDGRSLPQLARDYTEDTLRFLHAVVVGDIPAPVGVRVQAALGINRLGWADKPRVDPAANRQIVVTTIAHDDPRLAQWEARRLEHSR